MKLSIGFSPCPNDTFIFDALVNKKIDVSGFEFEPVLTDVQTLNEWALEGRLDVSKISYGVLPLLLEHYQVLAAGGALGKGVGPLLIAKKAMTELEINAGLIGIPGVNTTANLLFSLAYPRAKNRLHIVFSALEDAVISGEIDAAVIIHENRFTYHNKGLIKIKDLGEFWETTTGAPIPLGGIVTRRAYDDQLKLQINDMVRQSVQYALNHYPVVTEYVKQHAQDMNEQIMRSHIDLYVNDYSVSLMEDGREAVDRLLMVYSETNKVNVNRSLIFAGE